MRKRSSALVHMDPHEEKGGGREGKGKDVLGDAPRARPLGARPPRASAGGGRVDADLRADAARDRASMR